MIVFNSGRCVGCHACQVACKAEKGLPLGVFGITVLNSESVDEDGRYRIHFRALMCRHCLDALCVKVCPVRAVTRDRSGNVSIERERCIGCRLCLLSCPHSAPFFDDHQRMVKCNACTERTGAGLKPACVASCPVAALEMESPGELSARKRREALRRRCRGKSLS